VFRYVTPNRPTHDDVPPLDQPAPTQTAAIPTKAERLAVEATRSSLNYHPGCIKVVDTFRFADDQEPHLRLGVVEEAVGNAGAGWKADAVAGP
jgi:hypothetical protein